MTEIGQDLPPLVLYMKLLRQVLYRHTGPVYPQDRGSFRRPVGAGVIILAYCGLHERAAHCIKRRPMIGCNQHVPRSPVRPNLVSHWQGW
jgi:hypothetical protein